MVSINYKEVVIDRNNEKLMFYIVGENESYELLVWMRTDANEGKRVEVKLSGENTWYLDFKSLFKVFQFLEQLRIFQYKLIDLSNKHDLSQQN